MKTLHTIEELIEMQTKLLSDIQGLGKVKGKSVIYTQTIKRKVEQAQKIQQQADEILMDAVSYMSQVSERMGLDSNKGGE